MRKRNKDAKKNRLPLIRRKWYLNPFWLFFHYVLDVRVFFSMSRFLATIDEGAQIGLKARKGLKKKQKDKNKKKKKKNT